MFRFYRNFLKKYAEKLPASVVPALILFAGAIYIFSHIAHEVFSEKEEQTDNNILHYLAEHAIKPRTTEVMKTFTYMGTAPFLQAGYAVLIILELIPKNYKRAIEVLAVGVSGVLVNLAMKYSFHRLRPPDPLIEPLKSFSFPSGHATSGFIFYGFLVYMVWKTKLPTPLKIFLSMFLISLALMIGFSRVYLRLHYPSDVVAGFCIGFAWLLILTSIMEYLKKKSALEVMKEQTHLKE